MALYRNTHGVETLETNNNPQLEQNNPAHKARKTTRPWKKAKTDKSFNSDHPPAFPQGRNSECKEVLDHSTRDETPGPPNSNKTIDEAFATGVQMANPSEYNTEELKDEDVHEGNLKESEDDGIDVSDACRGSVEELMNVGMRPRLSHHSMENIIEEERRPNKWLKAERLLDVLEANSDETILDDDSSDEISLDTISSGWPFMEDIDTDVDWECSMLEGVDVLFHVKEPPPFQNWTIQRPWSRRKPTFTYAPSPLRESITALETEPEEFIGTVYCRESGS